MKKSDYDFFIKPLVFGPLCLVLKRDNFKLSKKAYNLLSIASKHFYTAQNPSVCFPRHFGLLFQYFLTLQNQLKWSHY